MRDRYNDKTFIHGNGSAIALWKQRTNGPRKLTADGHSISRDMPEMVRCGKADDY